MAIIDNIRNLLDDYVSLGGNVNDLRPGDRLYDYIKDAKLYGEDGRKLTVDEKFIKAGHKRDALYHLREKVKVAAESYLSNGGSFHVERKSLPFYPDLKSYVRAYKREYDRDISYDEAMKGLGFNNYSTIFYKYAHVMDLKDYQDEAGFVDGYRKDEVMKSYIHQAAKFLNVPIAIIVSLIGDQNLRKYSLDVDYVEELKRQILKELEIVRSKAVFFGSEGGSEGVTLENLKETNLTLYNRIVYLKRRMVNAVGSELSYDDVMYLLELDKNLIDFKDVPEKPFDVQEAMVMLYEKAREQDGKLYRKDIPKTIYRDIVRESLKQGCYTKDMFDKYGIDYVDGANNQRFKRFTVDEYPYLSRMRADRDNFMKKFIKENPDACSEEVFEYYFKTCLDIYEVYKDKIFLSNESDDSINEEKRC